MDAQRRIDRCITLIDRANGSSTGVEFIAKPIGSPIIVQHDRRTVHVSASWVDGVDDALLERTLLHEVLHQDAQLRHSYNVAVDAAIESMIGFRIGPDDLITSAGNGPETPEEGLTTTDRSTSWDPRFHYVEATKDGMGFLVGFAPDDAGARSDGSAAGTYQERLQRLLDRLKAEGYQVGPTPRTTAPDDDPVIAHGPRTGGRIAIGNGIGRAMIAGKALMAAAPVPNDRFDRRDENDSWNRSQGRRGGGRRKGR